MIVPVRFSHCHRCGLFGDDLAELLAAEKFSPPLTLGGQGREPEDLGTDWRQLLAIGGVLLVCALCWVGAVTVLGWIGGAR